MSATSPAAKNRAKPHNRYAAFLACVAIVSACSEPREPFSLEFLATYDGQPIHCGSEPIALTDLRLYVSEIVINGSETVPLLRDERWQTRELALIDLENGSGACANGSEAMNAVVRGTAAVGPINGLALTIGVPFELNHADPLRAEAPLNDSQMHWHWRSGYKFMRAGLANAEDSFWIHLGSTACEGTITNISHCNAPNRVRIELPDFQPGDKIEIDFKAMLGEQTLNDSQPGDCSSGPAESACRQAFQALGLAHSGESMSTTQNVFKLRQ